MDRTAKDIHIHVTMYKPKFSFPLGKYPGIGLWDYMVSVLTLLPFKAFEVKVTNCTITVNHCG